MADESILEYRNLPPWRQASVGVLVAWLVILSAVALALFSSTRTQSKAPTSGGIQMDMISRYVVGAHAIYGKMPGMEKQQPQMTQQVRQIAVSEQDKLRLIPIIGELQGKDSAEDSAQQFLQTSNDPELCDDALILKRIYAPTTQPISKEQTARLEARHGWYGRLAVSSGAGDADPVRAQVIGQAKKTFITILSMFGLILVLGLAGLVLMITLIVKFAGGTLRPRYPQMPASPKSADIFVEGFAVYLVFMVLISLPPIIFHRVRGLEWNALLFVPIIAAIIWARMRGVGLAQMRTEAGWTTGTGVLREMAAGIVGYISGLPLIVIGFVLASILSKYSHQHMGHPIEHYITDGGAHRAIIVLLACVFAPIVEETMFRGFLQAHLRFRHGWIVSALVVSAIFAAIHPQGWAAIPVLGSIAIILSALREQRQSLIASMTAHCLNNTLALLVVMTALG